MFKDKLVAVIIETGSPLKPDEVDEAIGGMSNLCWRGLTQLIEGYRQEHAASAARMVQQEKPLAAASDNGAYEALSGLIEDLTSRRKPTD